MSESLKTEQCFYRSSNFRNTSFVKSIMKEFGSKGYVLILATLEEIGRNGTVVHYDQSFIDRIVVDFPEVSRNLLDMVVRKMAKKGFLDRKAFESRKELTPPSSCVVDSVEAVFDGSHEKSPYLFVRPSVFSVDSELIQVSSEETPINSEKISQSGGSCGNCQVKPQNE